MWEAPSRDRGTPEPGASGGGDALGGPPDSSRPANPWPRLLAFGACLLIMTVLAGTCLVSYARPPVREIKEPITEFELGTPKFFPITTFGADRAGRTYGVAVNVHPDGTASAVLTKDAETHCTLRWDGTAPGGAGAPRNGAFVDPCGPARYTSDGAAHAGTTPSSLHSFPARVEDRRLVIVDLSMLTLGACGPTTTRACSTAGKPELRSMPSTGLPGDVGR